ncbi:MAG: hypothetical protein ABWZ64_07045 [Xanthobacteraceae bacterium]|jgi:hypothetical protein
MSQVDSTLGRNDEEFLNFAVSDEALESAEGTEALANYTYYGCTYQYCGGY